MDQPTIVTLHVHDHRLLLGLGLPESFVQLERESGDPPYIATVGDPNADDVVAFYLHGEVLMLIKPNLKGYVQYPADPFDLTFQAEKVYQTKGT